MFNAHLGTWFTLLAVLVFAVQPVATHADVAVSDGDFALSEDQLKYLAENWPEDVRAAAIEDVAARYGLLDIIAQNTRLSDAALAMTEENDGEDFYQLQLLMRSTLRDFMLRRFRENLDVPDMESIARERYEAQRRKYAFVPETRLSSHILLRCDRYKCAPRSDQMKDIIARLEAGERFESLATELSEDPGSRKAGGKFSQWITVGQSNIDEAYRQALFKLEREGDVSGVVNSNFGLHIIRLDGVREERYRPFEEVKGSVLADLEREYIQQQTRAYQESFGLTEDVVIDPKSMERIFTPYKTD